LINTVYGKVLCRPALRNRIARRAIAHPSAGERCAHRRNQADHRLERIHPCSVLHDPVRARKCCAIVPLLPPGEPINLLYVGPYRLDRVTTGRDAASGTKRFCRFLLRLNGIPFARPRSNPGPLRSGTDVRHA
jgi:hypothetical protein